MPCSLRLDPEATDWLWWHADGYRNPPMIPAPVLIVSFQATAANTALFPAPGDCLVNTRTLSLGYSCNEA